MKVPVRKEAVLGDCAAGDRMDIIASHGLEEGCCRSGMKFVGEGALVKCGLIEFVAVCSDASLFHSVAHKNRFKRRIGARSREDAGAVGTMVSARPNVNGGPWN